jgi:hypothetical protein
MNSNAQFAAKFSELIASIRRLSSAATLRGHNPVADLMAYNRGRTLYDLFRQRSPALARKWARENEPRPVERCHNCAAPDTTWDLSHSLLAPRCRVCGGPARQLDRDVSSYNGRVVAWDLHGWHLHASISFAQSKPGYVAVMTFDGSPTYYVIVCDGLNEQVGTLEMPLRTYAQAVGVAARIAVER